MSLTKKEFESNHSEFERRPEKVKEYVELIEKEVGHGFKVEAILEIGSYAKDEAVPGSDVDTRIFFSSPDYYMWQTSGGRFADSKKKLAEKKFEEFLTTTKELPRFFLDWFEFNDPVSERIKKMLGINIEFGLADIRFAQYELKQLESQASQEHQLFLQSNVLYDPNGFLTKAKSEIVGKIYQPLVSFYQERYLDKLLFEVYTHLEPHKMDDSKLHKSRQLQWVKWGVRAVRDAVGAKTYIQTGNFVYQKDEVIGFCQKNLSIEDCEVIREIYTWKTNPEVREEMINDFLKDSKKYFKLFTDKTKSLEGIITRINKL